MRRFSFTCSSVSPCCFSCVRNLSLEPSATSLMTSRSFLSTSSSVTSIPISSASCSYCERWTR
jgi:hypothetical protein